MVLKAEMQSQETEPSNFYSSPRIEAEQDIQSGKFEAFLSHHSVRGCQDLCYTTVQYCCSRQRYLYHTPFRNDWWLNRVQINHSKGSWERLSLINNWQVKSSTDNLWAKEAQEKKKVKKNLVL